MKKHTYLFIPVFVLLGFGVAYAEQHPLLNMIADQVIQKYQNASCEDLWKERAEKQGQPKPEKEQEFIQLMQTNPDLRKEFIDKIAPPVANKMFECGMIP